MNSNFRKGSSGSTNFSFDLGIGSNRPVSLKDQKNPSSSSFSSYTSTTTQAKPAWQPNKPSWTHQPAPAQATGPGLNGPTSMVGDIHGKSWNSTGSGSGIGIVEKNPNLFGDLVSSALGQGNKGNSNVPLKNATPNSKNSASSMGNVADSLPKSSNSATGSGNWGSNGSNFTASGNGNANFSSNKSSNLSGPSMKTMMGGSGGGVGLGGNQDPFGSLVDLASKQASGSRNSAAKTGKTNASDDVFESKTNAGHESFGSFQNAAKPSTPSFTSNNFMGTNTSFGSSTDDFGINNKGFDSQKQPPIQTTNEDPLDIFFSPSATASGGGAAEQQFSELDDWGVEPEFNGGGNDSGSATTELEGLPPPPAGVTASAAKKKGIDNQKQGQYADAIKWLSWAVVLLAKSGDSANSMEVLSCRASCYKEVGEYKKAVADCTKVLEFDGKNTAALVQRALLYESMEKYKLGAEDLRTVLKIDPANRIARSTIHRLTKMVN